MVLVELDWNFSVSMKVVKKYFIIYLIFNYICSLIYLPIVLELIWWEKKEKATLEIFWLIYDLPNNEIIKLSVILITKTNECFKWI